jgi:hypothetical protein
LTLGEQGWSFTRLVKAFRWHRDPEWLAGVTELAHEMGLIPTVTKTPETKQTKQPSSEPDDEPLIVPVPLRPTESKPVNIIKLSDRRGPAPWTVEGENDDGR